MKTPNSILFVTFKDGLPSIAFPDKQMANDDVNECLIHHHDCNLEAPKCEVKKYYSEDLIEKIKDKIRLLAYEYTHNNTHPTFTAGGLKLAMDAIDEVLKDE